jgi:hypothetical protein
MKKLIIQHWKVFIESNLFVMLIINIAKIYAKKTWGQSINLNFLVLKQVQI